MKKDNKGMTVIEVIIVLAIIAVVVSIGYRILNNNTLFSKEQSNISKDNHAVTALETYLIKDIERSEDVRYIENEQKYIIDINDNNKIEYKININKNKELYITRSEIKNSKITSEIELISKIKIDSNQPFTIDDNKMLGEQNYTITLDTQQNKEPYTIQIASKKTGNSVASDTKYLTLGGPYKGTSNTKDPKYPYTLDKKLEIGISSREERPYINGSNPIPIDIRATIDNGYGALDIKNGVYMMYKPYKYKENFNKENKSDNSDDRYPSDMIVSSYDVKINLTGNDTSYTKVELDINSIEYSNGTEVTKNIRSIEKVKTIARSGMNTLQFEFDDETKISNLEINKIGLHPNDKDRISPQTDMSGYRGYRIEGLPNTDAILDISFTVEVKTSKSKDPDQRLGIQFGK